MRVGMIGCGGIAPTHIRVYKSLENVNLVSLCDLNFERAKALASKFRVEKTYGNYIEMFEKEDLDLVDICTPASTHCRIVCDAAEYVPAILVEKPMALNVSECDTMIREVKKHSTKLCIGHNQIFSPNILRAKALINSGEFKVWSFETVQKESFELLKAHDLAPAWNVEPEQRGIIWEVCCHLAYIQLHFIGDVKEVYAVGGKVRYPVYDDFTVLLRTGGQHFGVIELSWVSKETEIVYELRDVLGKRLQIHRDFDYLVEKSESPPFNYGSVLRSFLVDEKRLLQKWTKFGLSYVKKKKLLPTFNLISTYIDNIEKDLPSPVSPEDGRNTINLLECIEKSLNEKRPISLSQ
ncbi:Gfo/Idh/MocA family oxidoreductase [Candidatus Bathyarchaeota archaeon]|nr:Gfo/Idh/MocA family oxidoreductase [Candidatus Bathyarchaeota archaeon]